MKNYKPCNGLVFLSMIKENKLQTSSVANTYRRITNSSINKLSALSVILLIMLEKA